MRREGGGRGRGDVYGIAVMTVYEMYTCVFVCASVVPEVGSGEGGGECAYSIKYRN